MPRQLKLDPIFQQGWKERAQQARIDAAKLPQGVERDGLLRLARQLETASHMSDWLRSPGLARQNE